ncbi:hypothetical protein BDB01DRAFT_537810 [Pilobolus umbonatus]|nr:hypothetical protein BDB01DRAFT_537810 [Pilobolus umbonatus]
MIPVTFHIGYSLILGNLIAKNYRIYRIFNNIFITRTIVTDIQLLKVSGTIIGINAIILVIWLTTNTISIIPVNISYNSYYNDCNYEGVDHRIFISLLALSGALQLGFATFLAFKTRAVGKTYSKYSEYKQIGLSVYNIFFSALIGFIIFCVPSADYYTRHYLTATLIVWATTFSLLALFLPKLHEFFFPARRSVNNVGKASDLSGRQRMHHSNILSKSDKIKADFIPPRIDNYDMPDLISLNNMVHGFDNPIHSKSKMSNVTRKGCMQGVLMEVHEAEVPIQLIYRYFPFFSAWEMIQIVLMPGISYFSYYSEKTNRGSVFAYSGSSIVSSDKGEYVLKVHGLQKSDIFMQVGSEKDLLQWNDWFNKVPSIETTYRLPPKKEVKTTDVLNSENSRKRTDFSDYSKESAQEYPDINYIGERILNRQNRLDSGITAQHLLEDEEDKPFPEYERRESEMTCVTMEDCYFQPIFLEYGSDKAAIREEHLLRSKYPAAGSNYSTTIDKYTTSDDISVHPNIIQCKNKSVFHLSPSNQITHKGSPGSCGSTVLEGASSNNSTNTSYM